MTRVITTAELMNDADCVLFKQVRLPNHCSHHLLLLFAYVLTYNIEAIFTSSPLHLQILPSSQVLSTILCKYFNMFYMFYCYFSFVLFFLDSN